MKNRLIKTCSLAILPLAIQANASISSELDGNKPETEQRSASVVEYVSKSILADSVVFPDTKDSYLAQPLRHNVSEVSKLDTGLNKDTIRAILGNPHFSEFSSKNWNYWLSIKHPDTGTYQDCQLQVAYDKDVKAIAYYWNSSTCASLSKESFKPEPPKNPSTPPESPSQKQKVQKTYTLASNTLFDFNGFSKEDISQKTGGYQLLETTFKQINQDFDSIESIQVIGHTDRLGGQEYNYNLGLKRAMTIRDMLVSNGYPYEVIKFSSKGELYPTKETILCNNSKTAENIDCLKADRRVEVKVIGVQSS